MSGMSGPEAVTDGDVVFQSHVRMLEALLFAAAEPLDAASLKARLPDGADIEPLLAVLQRNYATRGVNLVCVGGRWTFRTAPDLSFLLEQERHETRRLSRAAVETLAIIAYHQPVTRAEIEQIRGVVVGKGTLDVLIEAEWVKILGRRQTPGRPVTYGTTEAFLAHFGLPGLDALPGIEELKAAGFVDSAQLAAEEARADDALEPDDDEEPDAEEEPPEDDEADDFPGDDPAPAGDPDEDRADR